MMKMKFCMAAVATLAVSGCGSYAWRLETKPAAWAETDWTREFGAADQAKVVGETTYVGAEKGIYALKAGGAKLWATSLPAGERSIAIGDGKIVVTSYSVNKEAKTHGFTDRTSSNLNRRENGHVTAYGLADGQQLWDVPFDGDGSRLSPPAVGGGKALVVSDRKLLALDLGTGAVVWSQQMVDETGVGKLFAGFPYTRQAPAIAGNQVCAVLKNKAGIYDLGTGAVVAENDEFKGYHDAEPLAADGVCYFGQSRDRKGGWFSGSNQVWTLNLADSTQKKKLKRGWDGDTGDKGPVNLVMTSKGLLATSYESVRLIDTKTGKKLWAVEGEPVKPTTKADWHFIDPKFNFTMDFSSGITFNDWPGTGFAANDSKAFVVVSYKDKDDKKRHIVTALDTATGAYLGSYDGAGSKIHDVAIAGDVLVMATSDGIRTAKLDAFVAPVVPAK